MLDPYAPAVSGGRRWGAPDVPHDGGRLTRRGQAVLDEYDWGDDAPPATQPDDQPVRCAEWGGTFPGVEAATEHYYSTHGKADEEGEPTA